MATAQRPPPTFIIIVVIWLGLVAPALAQVPEVPAASTSAGLQLALWTLAAGVVANIVLAVIKNRHDERVTNAAAAAAQAAEKMRTDAETDKENRALAAEQRRLDAEAAKEERRIAAETAKEERLRQWQLEDRDRLAREVATTAQTLAARVDRVSTDLAKTAAASHEVIIGKLDENTQISKDAFEVNNHVKERWADTTGALQETTGVLRQQQETINRLAARFLDDKVGAAQAAAVSDRRLAALEVPGTAAAAAVLNRVDQTTQETLAATQETLEVVKQKGE